MQDVRIRWSCWIVLPREAEKSLETEFLALKQVVRYIPARNLNLDGNRSRTNNLNKLMQTKQVRSTSIRLLHGVVFK